MPLRFARFVFLLLVFVPSPSVAQLAPVQLPSPANTAPTYILDGVVLNSMTGQPIRAALVQMYGRGQVSVLTGADGKFHFEGLPQGQISLSVRKPGFFNEREGVVRNEVVRVDANMQPVVLKLVPESVLYGRVTDPDGEPAESVPVKLLYQTVENGEMRWQQRAAQTNEDGEFRLFDLRAGTYYLKAGPSFTTRARASSSLQTRREGYESTFFPGVPDLESAAAIVAAPGKQIRADLSLRSAAFYQVAGTVVGHPIGASFGVQFMTKEGEALPSGVRINPSTGAFTGMTIPAGSYVIRAFARINNGQQSLVATLPLNVNSDVAGVHLALGPPATIPVTVEFELTPKSNPESFPPGGQPVSIELRSTRSAFLGQQAQAMMEGPPENRSFAIRNLEPGTYKAQVRPNGPWYVESARCGQTNLLTQELIVASGGLGQPIEVVLRDDFATIEGTVSSDGHAAPASVLLIPENSPTATMTVFVNETGKLQQRNLAPGEYRAFAFDRTDGLEYANPEAMRPYLSRAQFIRLAPNGQATVNLELQRRGE
jgi:hypothetical protein